MQIAKRCFTGLMVFILLVAAGCGTGVKHTPGISYYRVDLSSKTMVDLQASAPFSVAVQEVRDEIKGVPFYLEFVGGRRVGVSYTLNGKTVTKILDNYEQYTTPLFSIQIKAKSEALVVNGSVYCFEIEK